MKITFFVSGSVRSNFSHRALTLARQLSDFGHTVSVVAPKADKYNNFNPEKVQEINGVKIVQPFQFNTRRLEFNLIPYIFSATLNIFRNNADIVCIYKPTPISLVGVFSKFIWGSILVLDMDDLGSEVMKIEGHPWYQKKLVEWSELLAARCADRIVVVSTFLFKMYSNKYPNKKILLMPNGVDVAWFEPLVPLTGSRSLIFFGSLNRTNILDPLIDVLPSIFLSFPNLQVTIIGDGNYLKYFKEKCQSIGIQDKVDFTGWLSLEEARTHLHAGNLGYCYIPDEITNRAASNMKVSQYLSRGVLPIVSDVGDLRNSVNNGDVGYIALAGDTDSLCKTIIAALNDSEWLSKSVRAQQYAKEKFQWKELAKSFEKWIIGQQFQQARRRKIVIVTTELPSLGGGARIRNYYLAKELAANGFSVEVICISSNFEKEELVNLNKLDGLRVRAVLDRGLGLSGIIESLLLRVIPYMRQYRRSDLIKILRKSIEEEVPDIIQLEQINAYYAVEPILRDFIKRGVRVVLDEHNIEHILLEKTLPTLPLFKKIVGYFILPNLRRIEQRAVAGVDLVLACSESDKSGLEEMGAKNVFLVPNGVDINRFIPTSPASGHNILFMGGTTYPPNEDALRWYFDKIHDLLLKKYPDLKFYAIGSKPAAWLDRMVASDSSIILPGFVPDEREYLKKATVCISPMRIGSGTGLKILSYMASARPVVSTSVGARGIECQNGYDIEIADTAKIFYEKIVNILDSPLYAREMGANARSTMEQKYDWKKLVSKLAERYASLLQK